MTYLHAWMLGQGWTYVGGNSNANSEWSQYQRGGTVYEIVVSRWAQGQSNHSAPYGELFPTDAAPEL